MNQQLSKLLILGGLLGAGYYVFNRFSKQLLPFNKTCKILQEIKHQILIVTINYAEGTRDTIQKINKTNPEKKQEVFQFFRNKIIEIYNQKQQLILGKYEIPKEIYAQSLQFYKNNEKIKLNQEQIIDMMDRAINGNIPNLNVDARVSKQFTKDKLVEIYEDMSKMILVHILTKFQKQEQINPNFDSNNQNHFKKAIRELNIYDKKVQFFKSRGFNEEWGCPNENFFKLTEGLKLKDPDFKEQMKRLQKIYQQVVDVATKNPSSITVSGINNYYNRVPQPPSKNIPHYRQQPRFVNLNSSTKSDPESEQNQKNVPIFTNVKSKLHLPKTHSLKVEHQQKQIQGLVHPQVELKIEKENKQTKVSINDVPNDAHQLAKQTNSDGDTHVVINKQKQQNNINKEDEQQGSNVSIDGGQGQPKILQQKKQDKLNVQVQQKVEENKINEENNIEEVNPQVQTKIENHNNQTQVQVKDAVNQQENPQVDVQEVPVSELKQSKNVQKVEENNIQENRDQEVNLQVQNNQTQVLAKDAVNQQANSQADVQNVPVNEVEENKVQEANPQAQSKIEDNNQTQVLVKDAANQQENPQVDVQEVPVSEQKQPNNVQKVETEIEKLEKVDQI